MPFLVQHLWLIPALPLAAAAFIALTPRAGRRRAAGAALGAIGLSFLLSVAAFAATLHSGGETPFRQTFSFTWMELGATTLALGWVLDPLTAIMAVMVTFVSGLVFVYSAGYMDRDPNFTRFFGFLSLFAAAMLGLVIANSLLLLFMCWELVGLASYLLIGFWFQKPAAAAAARKAFITTRIGDLLFLLGMVWLYSETGSLLFYDHGQGCMEQAALTRLGASVCLGGIAVPAAIGVLLFCGAAGKSGQVPLHVWLPDAMEGPTPVSALIHAATMVAAGVFLMARVYPLLAAGVPGHGPVVTPALQVIAWTGAITALFAASVAVAQTDLKRILAYSTVSQLGYMFLGLGVGGVAVAMFHLIAHAFFKALLFLGAGSVIHGCHEEQDIRRLGGLRRAMPLTFVTYAIGMMALSGVPLLFSGFWSKDEILHAARHWPSSAGPFVLGLAGALLTAFYMARQVCLVFFGKHRGPAHRSHGAHDGPHESPPLMTVPLVVLAFCAVGFGFLGTPFWPWFQTYLGGHTGESSAAAIAGTMLLSTLAAAAGLYLGWRLYGRRPPAKAEDPDPLSKAAPVLFGILRNRGYVDEFYEASAIPLSRWWAGACDFLDRNIWDGLTRLTTVATLALSWGGRLVDEWGVNLGFDRGCEAVLKSGGRAAGIQDGRLHNYLRLIAVSMTVLALLLTWGCAQ